MKVIWVVLLFEQMITSDAHLRVEMSGDTQRAKN